MVILIALAIAGIVLADFYVFGDRAHSVPVIAPMPYEAPSSPAQEQARLLLEKPEPAITPPPPVRVSPDDGKPFFESVPEAPSPPVKAEPVAAIPKRMTPPPEGGAKAPKIAIIIDDMGVDLKRSRQVIELPAPLTLAFLPHGSGTPTLSAQAKDKGHTLIIHAPMEAMHTNAGLGPIALKIGMDDEALSRVLERMFQSFDGYEGLNNHMGSRLTQDKTAMKTVMEALKSRGLFFVDSLTIDTSVAYAAARDAGIPYAVRDVFLDHEETQAFVMDALHHAEKTARRQGYAILIGHPKDHTIRALKDWIPDASKRGFVFVSVREVLIKPE